MLGGLPTSIGGRFVCRCHYLPFVGHLLRPLVGHLLLPLVGHLLPPLVRRRQSSGGWLTGLIDALLNASQLAMGPPVRVEGGPLRPPRAPEENV